MTLDQPVLGLKQAQAELERLLGYPEPLYHDADALNDAFEFWID